MPRNGSGTMSTPNSFSSGATISSSAMNANFNDVASEITNSLPRDGQAAMTGQLKAASGTAAAPGIAFGSDTDTGLYRKAGNEIGISAGGTEVGAFTSKGLTGLAGIPTGVMMPYGATTAPSGWVRVNGRTIGSAASGATERANADTEDLYTLLWNNYSDSVCAVSSGRGASASADFAANKPIALPDLRGRSFFGLDDMGNSAASRIGTIVTSATTNGASGGSETVTLTSAQSGQKDIIGATVSVSDPGHSHLAGENDSGVFSAGGTTLVRGGGQTRATTTATTGISATLTLGGSDASSAHSNMPPAFLTTFIIKL